MIQPAKRLENISEYIFSKLGKEIKKVEEASGRKVLNFAQGNPDIKPSEQYIQKLQEFIAEEKSHYYPGYGAIPEFSQALQDWYQKRFNVTVEKDELLPLLGAKEGLSHLPLALFDEGDEVLVPNPGYPAYTDPTKLVGAKPVFYDLLEKNNFKLNLPAIQANISKKTKAVWVNFPSNPTGQVISVEELEQLVSLARKNNIVILYDNAYSEITFENYTAPSILEIKDAEEVAVEIGSFSKTFSFAGFRIGWVVGNKDIIAALAKVKSQIDSGMALPLQRLGAYALTNLDQKWHDEMIQTYQKRREILSPYLQKLGLSFSLPKGSLYIWAKIPNTEKNAQAFCTKLLHEKQILLTPGTAFGTNGERYVRVSVGTDIETIDQYF